MTPARSRTTLVALLVTLAVTSGAAGLRLLAAEPGAAAPRRLLIDSAGLRAPVVPVGAGADGALAIPRGSRHGRLVGRERPAGDRRGSTVLAGHVDSADGGLGALSALGTLPPGTRIVLVDVFGARHPYPKRAAGPAPAWSW